MNNNIKGLLENICKEIDTVKQILDVQSESNADVGASSSPVGASSTIGASSAGASFSSVPGASTSTTPVISSSATSVTGASLSATEQQMRVLFPQMCGGRRQRKDLRSPFIKDTFTREFSCLPFHYSTATPSSQMAITVEYAGLGKKKISFEGNDSHPTVVEKIYKAYPRLRKCGMFSLCRANGGGNNRPVKKINANQYDTKTLRRCLKGRAIVYIRPLQESLSLATMQPDESEDFPHVRSPAKVTCIKCNAEIQLSSFEKHRLECKKKKRTIDVVESDKEESESDKENTPVDVSSDEGDDIHNVEENGNESVGQLDGNNLLKDFISANKQEQNPTILLQNMQTAFQRGRQLEVDDEAVCPTGLTSLLLVERDDLLESGLSEISSISEEDKYLTVEVQFSGEAAKDYGGPRKEFLRLMLLEIKEKYFDYGVIAEKSKDYFNIGFLMGLSMLQNGKIPQFLGEDIINKIFNVEGEISPCILELRKGLARLGIYQVGKEIPIFQFLFQPTNHSLNLRELKHTMIRNVNNFAEVGTNKLMKQKEIYKKFQEYLNEVAAGRREYVTLEKILRFVTGTDEVPLLGYRLQPHVYFLEKTDLIPTSSTCINRLILYHPAPGVALPEDMFHFFDLAFTSTIFGRY